MNARDDAIEAGAQALHGDECPDDEHDLCDVGAWDRAAAAVVDAVEPIIRERIAQEIEALIGTPGWGLADYPATVLQHAARIARGDTPTRDQVADCRLHVQE